MTIDPVSTKERAAALLADVGRSDEICVAGEHPALAWRRSGLMDVTGRREGAGLVCPAALTVAADAALAAIGALAPGVSLPLNGALLLGERSRLMGLTRNGRISPNGTCRLIDTAEGRLALSLARDDDWGLVPAWLETEAADWEDIATVAATRSAADLVARGIELGLPIAHDLPPQPTAGWFDASASARTRHGGPPLVIDLASLWAGPLASSLLGMTGARVVKVESAGRPDGARRGHPGFHDLLNGGKESIAIDFTTAEGRAALRRLVERADIVIEGSRPRALRQLGLDAEEVVGRGTIWISITGHGRAGEAGERVGFGDDAAAAAGLSSIMESGWGEAMFVGDAIADPLTGLHAALAALAAWRNGEARLIALSLRETVAHAVGAGVVDGVTLREWQAMAERDSAPFYPLRRVTNRARALGADTVSVLGEC